MLSLCCLFLLFIITIITAISIITIGCYYDYCIYSVYIKPKLFDTWLSLKTNNQNFNEMTLVVTVTTIVMATFFFCFLSKLLLSYIFSLFLLYFSYICHKFFPYLSLFSSAWIRSPGGGGWLKRLTILCRDHQLQQKSGGQLDFSVSSSMRIALKLMDILGYKNELQKILKKSHKDYDTKLSLLPIKVK